MDSPFERFADIWALGVPSAIEAGFRDWLAQPIKDSSVHQQAQTQLVLALALQKRFDDAHRILDELQANLSADDRLVQARVLLERGRICQQSENNDDARRFVEQAYELSASTPYEMLTIDAAHMRAILGETNEQKIEWNLRALDRAGRSTDPSARAWLGSLSHNQGQFEFDAGRYDVSLQWYREALTYREREGYAPNIRVARWAIARSLRYMGREDEAGAVLTALEGEYAELAASGKLDMPEAMLPLLRGMVLEEMAEIHAAKARQFATRAYADLAIDPMFSKMETRRLDRLKRLSAD